MNRKALDELVNFAQGAAQHGNRYLAENLISHAQNEGAANYEDLTSRLKFLSVLAKVHGAVHLTDRNSHFEAHENYLEAERELLQNPELFSEIDFKSTKMILYTRWISSIIALGGAAGEAASQVLGTTRQSLNSNSESSYETNEQFKDNAELGYILLGEARTWYETGKDIIARAMEGAINLGDPISLPIDRSLRDIVAQGTVFLEYLQRPQYGKYLGLQPNE